MWMQYFKKYGTHILGMTSNTIYPNNLLPSI